MIKEQYKYSDITAKIIGSAMEVHKILGNGFQEVIYQRALAKVQLEEVHLAQAINYLEAYNLEIGMLINFGAKSLQFKRLINSKFNRNEKSI
ncbi:hypothetical protein FACS189413_06010 [Bacteroidia bacterium]|nr:hypothetical protein FACS189413_06010 [Bacteroidia bacterium]